MADRTTQITPHEGQAASRRELSRYSGPHNIFDRFADEMDRLFEDFGFGSRGLTPWGGSRQWPSPLQSARIWAPDIEVYQRNNELVVRADLPGLKREDIHIDVTDSEITISGERRQEEQTEREGIYRSERTYGSFSRSIALPEGAMVDQAKASFKEGVLEVTMPAPPQSTRARRLEIQEGSEKQRSEQKK